MSADESRPSPGRRARPVEKKALPPGPARDLRDAVYRLYAEADLPQLAQLAQQIAGDDDLIGSPGKDLIGKIISGDALAGQQDTVTVAVAVARAAGRGDVASIAEQVRQQWIAAATAGPAAAADDRLGRPVGACDPLVLEVHPTIQVPGEATADRLPGYVPRAHDTRLRELVDGMLVDGRSRLVTLVGGSSTGKTRAGWELARYLEGQRPGRWRLWHPFDPTRPQAALADLAKAGPDTIVWLNEAQHYLMPADPGLGERIVAGLRTLLTEPDRGPVLVLATLWPNYWITLTTRPTDGGPDVYGQARDLLALGTKVTLGDTFTPAELAGLADAGIDARLRYADKHAEGGRITQYLAGAPVLEDRYRTAVHTMPAARAILQVAIDARRLGHPLALPHALLEQAAPGYLDDHDWDTVSDDWLEAALAYTAQSCHGARGPLTRIRPRPGEPGSPGGQPCYRLADYLEQLGRHERASVFPPTSFWLATARHVHRVEDRRALATAAEDRGRFRHAATLLADGARGGDRESAVHLARLLHQRGRVDEAYPWWRLAAEAGDAGAMVKVGAHLERHGDTEQAIRWWTAAADAGDQEAPCRIAYHLQAAGRTDEARGWWRRAASVNGGKDYYANRTVMDFLLREGRSDEAMAWAPRRMSCSGGMIRWDALARLLCRQGRTDESIARWKEYIENKDPDHGDFGEILREATTTMLEAGQAEEMIAWLRVAAERGHEHQKHELVGRLTELGRVDEAVEWLSGYAATRANVVNDRTAGWIADLLLADGRAEEALASLQRAAAGGDCAALAQAVAMLQAAGRPREALDWLASDGPQSPANAKRTRVLCLMVRALRVAGHRSLALILLQQAANPDSGFGPLFMHFMSDADVTPARALQEWDDAYSRLDALALTYATFLVDDTGVYLSLLQRKSGAGEAGLSEEDDVRQVADWLRTRNDPDDWRSCGSASIAAGSGFEEEALAAYRRLGEPHRQVWLLERMGRVDEAVQLLIETSGVGADDIFVRRTIAGLLSRTRGPDEAVAFLRDDHDGIARLYAEAGHHQEAIHAWRRSADSGDPSALDQIAALLRREGDPNRARQLQRYGWAADGTDAQPWTVS